MNASLTIKEAAKVSRDELESLSQRTERGCVSLSMPTHPGSRERRQDPIRLRGLADEAGESLSEQGVSTSDVRALRERLHTLGGDNEVDGQEFWGRVGAGLAILATTDEMHVYSLRNQPGEMARVGRRFDLRPLLTDIQHDARYALVAVSRGDLRYFEGDSSGLSEVNLEDAPGSLYAVHEKAHQKGFALHSFNRGASGNHAAAVPHGHVDKDDAEAVKRYLGEIAAALEEEASDHADSAAKRAVVFAGVPEHFHLFREAAESCSLALVEEPVAIAPDHSTAEELHQLAWPLIDARLTKTSEKVLSRWRSAAHTEVATSDIEEVMKAAHDGRIETLLVAADAQLEGAYDPETRRVSERASDSERDDLVAAAIAATLQTGGQTRVVPRDDFELPPSGLAAILRYAAP
ncbi:hypothetical protein Pla108_13690 [Botrimarina colliarenosi]|uniref:Uncharacterized protein n=1 Tax=Botrimarina colliarenosi TaxID=2528001 RepID=A0A5C6ALR6_9BACT|nr:hypothetical protein [Botrimarina colliarenosi]TWU00418.1 hypothetical protein Pla108_13690 [Botrimarina colliarenosi]